MLFTLEVLPAKEGDCLLLHWGTAAKPQLALIDGGPKGVFKAKLGPRLERYRHSSGKEVVILEVVMVSHIDADHISGVNELVAKMRDDALGAAQVQRWEMKRLWHNTFNDVLGDATDAYYEKFAAGFTASAAGDLQAAARMQLHTLLAARPGMVATQVEHLVGDIEAVLASHPQGRALRLDHQILFDKTLTAKPNTVNAELAPALLTSAAASFLLQGLRVRIVGPSKAEIDALQAEFDTFLKDSHLGTPAALAAYADGSIPNLSSIVCLVSLGSGNTKRTILFTGDARGDKIIQGLRDAKLLDADQRIDIDILKVPHHGSDRNADPGFFETIRARHYVLSGNGLYGNPDAAVLRWIAEARGKGDDYTIHLTYEPAQQDTTHEAWATSKHKIYDPEADSLVRTLAALRGDGYHFSLLAGEAQQIDLGDEAAPW